jgi:hypothetical protein
VLVSASHRTAYCARPRRHAAPGAIERKYPHIVQLAVGTHGLDVGLSRRIMHFHNSRHINPRHGHIVLKEGQTHYRWCFSDSTTTQAFVEQFDGEISQAVATSLRQAVSLSSWPQCGQRKMRISMSPPGPGTIVIKFISAAQRQSGSSVEPASSRRSNFDITPPVPVEKCMSIGIDHQVN